VRPRETILQFSGLALGEHQFEFVLDETFFSEFPLQELEGLHPATVKVTLRKANHMLELDFAYEGAMDCTCDLSDDPFVLELKPSTTASPKCWFFRTDPTKQTSSNTSMN
jgi:hypothetical protein